MTVAALRYTVRKRGKLFWQPTKAMKAMGFLPLALGDDTPENQARALKLYEAWLLARATKRKVTNYPPGTFGAFYDRFRRAPAFGKKALRTREDYARAWARIDRWRPDPEAPSLSRTVVSRITTEICEQFYDHLDDTVSANERHRTFKWLKVLLGDMVVRLRLGYASPAAKIANPQPPGRWQIWLAAQVDQLAADAGDLGYEGMHFGIRIAWEAMLAPTDVWTLRPKELRRDVGGYYLHRARTKTGKEILAAISDGLALDLLKYLRRQNRERADNTPVLRQRNGQAYRSKDTFGDDFRAVRGQSFEGDDRQFLDLRRSANVEADAAGADKKTMGELLANGLANNRFLDETYTPPTVAKAREVAELRRQGRVKLAGEVQRLGATS